MSWCTMACPPRSSATLPLPPSWLPARWTPLWWGPTASPQTVTRVGRRALLAHRAFARGQLGAARLLGHVRSGACGCGTPAQDRDPVRLAALALLRPVDDASAAAGPWPTTAAIGPSLCCSAQSSASSTARSPLWHCPPSCSQQDRHVLPRRGRAPPRHPLLCGRAHHHHRPPAGPRRPHTH